MPKGSQAACERCWVSRSGFCRATRILCCTELRNSGADWATRAVRICCRCRPEDAERAIEAESALQLLTGGADLLRWSIAQRADGNDRRDCFDSTAVDRADSLVVWRRVQDRAGGAAGARYVPADRGIPLLVGELHRLVLPNPKTPPTWLGYAIWTNVKASFERRLPVLARELRNGSPAVRLTEQEIRVLKMVIIASDDSTPETISE